jgi:diketogulonate reductase-like aldo/keto reductase
VTAFSSFGAPSYVELSMAASAESCLADPVVQVIAAKVAKTPAQVNVELN